MKQLTISKAAMDLYNQDMAKVNAVFGSKVENVISAVIASAIFLTPIIMLAIFK